VQLVASRTLVHFYRRRAEDERIRQLVREELARQRDAGELDSGEGLRCD